MARDAVSVRLWLPQIRVLGVVADVPERLWVRVASTVVRPKCPYCGTPSGRTHDRRDDKVRDLEVSGRPVARGVGAVRRAAVLRGSSGVRGASHGSAAYKAAIDARLGHARHVGDRFHVIRWFQSGLTAARRDIQRRPEGEKPRFDPDVFGARFVLMRRPDKLDADQRSRLDKLFAAHPRLKAAWDALSELHNLYLAEDRKGALEALDRFADIYGTGQIPEFSDVVDTFLAWHEETLGWHRAGRPSNGRIEGTNNLLQVLRRKAHGFTNYTNFEARGILLT